MKVLVVGDYTSQPCGIRGFLDQTYAALSRHPGLDVHKWDGHYPEIYRRREAGEPTYLPLDAETYDVIHVNWHCIAFNTYGPDHFPKGPLLSVYLNDIPPWSGCPFHDRADVRFAAEESPGCIVLPYPVADWIDGLTHRETQFSLGCSTLRGDGVPYIAAKCKERRWAFRTPDRSKGWLSYEDEIRRIAQNTVNVLWYFDGRGKSGGLSQTISAQRPVLCSDSPMFSHFWDYRDEIYFAEGRSLGEMLDVVSADWQAGQLRIPQRAVRERSWSNATTQMVAAWEAARA